MSDCFRCGQEIKPGTGHTEFSNRHFDSICCATALMQRVKKQTDLIGQLTGCNAQALRDLDTEKANSANLSKRIGELQRINSEINEKWHADRERICELQAELLAVKVAAGHYGE